MRAVAHGVFCALLVVCYEAAAADDPPTAPAPDGLQPQPDAAELLRVLREGTGEAAAEALKALTRDPDTILADLPVLLAEAKDASERMDAGLVGGVDARGWWAGDFQTKGSLILARVADSIRESTDEAGRVRALNLLAPFVKEALDGKAPGVAPACALRAYYCSVFCPPGMGVAPRESICVEDVLSEVCRMLGDGDSRARAKAYDLLVDAAYVLPDHRERLYREIEARLGVERARQCKGWVDNMLGDDGEAVSQDQFLSIRRESEQELVDWLLRSGTPVEQREWQLRLDALSHKLPTSPDRAQLTLRLLSEDIIAQRFIGSLVPGPVPQTASESDRKFMDVLIGFIESEMAKAGEGTADSGYIWTPKALRMLALSDVDKLKKGVRSGSESTPQPYACERVVKLLVDALRSNSPSMQREAARELGNVCWLGEGSAQAALDGLTALRDHIEQTHDLSRPDAEFPSGGGWDDRPEKYIHNEVVKAIREAEEALAVFASRTPATRE